MAKKQRKTKAQTQIVAQKGGRPSKFTNVLALRIIKRMSHGETLKAICRDADMPDFVTVYRWQDQLEEFRNAFAQARVIGTHNVADECMEIADRKGLDPSDRRIMIDTRLRLIGMWNRKDYGERREIDVSGRLTLGELIEASYQRLEQRQQGMTDITPQIASTPHTDTQHTDALSTDDTVSVRTTGRRQAN